jgi:two-component system, chemotaxis family, sensor kinase CheA
MSGDSIPEELITPEMIESFVAETTDLLDSTEHNLLQIESDPSDAPQIDEAFRSIHTIKGNAGFFGFGNIEKMCMDIETRMDDVRKGKRKADHKIVTELLTNLDQLLNALHAISAGKDGPSGKGAAAPEGPATAGGSTSDTSSAAEEAAVKPAPAGQSGKDDGMAGEAPSEPEAAGEEDWDLEDDDEDDAGGGSGSYKPLGDLLVEMGVISENDVETALEEQQRKIGEILIKQGAAKEEIVEKVLAAQTTARAEAKKKDEQYKVKRKDIRVDMRRLDKLFDLMGELITAEAMVISHPEMEGVEIESFSRAASSMSKITREMQEITMAIRMIPLEGLFNKMRRLVRDLARKFEKKIDLHLSGQETEMDRNVIEEISDPMVHIIRNSIDHGIEDAAVRESRGKDTTGNIWLDAKYEGNEIWITIKDDGGGLNREKILKKARENGLIEGSGEEIPDEDAYKLIFEPGFSTADQVSEISGRGVGMDVVRRNIDKLRGKIGTESSPGSGTSIILKIPLTLAIIDSIIFRVGELLYSLPIEDIIEFQKIEKRQLTATSNGEEVLRLRDEIMPIIELYRFYNIKNSITDPEEGLFIIARTGQKKAAILVDEIIGNRQVVIKPLPDYMGEIRAVSGCSILGSGEISLILDTSALLKEMFE